MINQRVGEVVPLEIETETSTVAVLTDSDIPLGIRLTTDLTKMTADQGAWAIRNGDAWLAYLKANGGEVYQSTGASAVEVTPAEQFDAICDMIENVWLALTGNMKRRDLGADQIPEWVETLQSALEVMPSGYERHVEIIQSEIDTY